MKITLTRLLLSHKTYGTHLDSSRKTIDSDMEKRNYEAAGKILAKIWEEVVLDEFPIVVEYLQQSTKDSVEIDGKWVTAHYKILQYLVQITKCTDLSCCGNF